jgi:Uma2 family endonuclease
MHEIILPDNIKPALEWVNNRILQKVSPERSHALAQGRFWSALDAWACEHHSGTVGTEWRFLVQPHGEIARTLVPDVAYLSYERMPRDEQERTMLPRLAPDVVVEILSRDDRQANVEEKVRVYLCAGANVVFLVDTDKRTVLAIENAGKRAFGPDDRIRHRSLPGLSFPAITLYQSP